MGWHHLSLEVTHELAVTSLPHEKVSYSYLDTTSILWQKDIKQASLNLSKYGVAQTRICECYLIRRNTWDTFQFLAACVTLEFFEGLQTHIPLKEWLWSSPVHRRFVATQQVYRMAGKAPSQVEASAHDCCNQESAHMNAGHTHDTALVCWITGRTCFGWYGKKTMSTRSGQGSYKPKQNLPQDCWKPRYIALKQTATINWHRRFETDLHATGLLLRARKVDKRRGLLACKSYLCNLHVDIFIDTLPLQIVQSTLRGRCSGMPCSRHVGLMKNVTIKAKREAQHPVCNQAETCETILVAARIVPSATECTWEFHREITDYKTAPFTSCM